MESNHGSRENNYSIHSLSKRFPTLTTSAAVLLVTVLLLGGKSFALNVEAKAATPQSNRSVNANVANAARSNTNKNTGTSVTATVNDGVQYVTSSMSSSRYDPITVQQGVPLKWTLNVPNGALNGCNNSIVIPEYNLKVTLKAGDNLIEFMPDKSGTFAFSCWMGMIRSNISVEGEDGTVAANQDDGSANLPAGCCGR